jgi:hypothetical protein
MHDPNPLSTRADESIFRMPQSALILLGSPSHSLYIIRLNLVNKMEHSCASLLDLALSIPSLRKPRGRLSLAIEIRAKNGLCSHNYLEGLDLNPTLRSVEFNPLDRRYSNSSWSTSSSTSVHASLSPAYSMISC